MPRPPQGVTAITYRCRFLLYALVALGASFSSIFFYAASSKGRRAAPALPAEPAAPLPLRAISFAPSVGAPPPSDESLPDSLGCPSPPPPPPPPVDVASALATLRAALAAGPAPAAAAREGAFFDARTASALDAFASRQAGILNGTHPPRFVAWRVTGKTDGMGLGNRVLGLISALALAFATDRALIVVDDAIISAALEPIPPAEGGIDWSPGRAREAAAAGGGSFDAFTEFAWGLGMDSKCGCAEFFAPPLRDAVTLSMETTQYLAPCFTHNPHLRARFVAAFGGATAVFRPLMTRFLRLNAPLREELARFGAVLHPPRAAGAPRRHVVGLQIRTGHLIKPHSEEATFYRCGAQLGELAAMGRGAVTRSSEGGGGGGAPDAAAALAALERALTSGGNGGVDGSLSPSQPSPDVEVFYFLATDSEAVRARARAALGADRVITYAGGGATAAVIDTWALSLCDDVVLTYPKSTFGFVGALLSPTGLPPHVVVSGSKTTGECVRLTSTEPVFHGWFMRWFAECYDRSWETGDMLNQESAYFCLMQPRDGVPPTQWGTHACPASDSADGLLFVQSPFDYEALDELNDPESFWGDAGACVNRKQLMARFEGPYRDFVKRAGLPLWKR